MAVLRALGFDCSGYLGKTFVLPQCDADLAILVPLVLGGRDGAAAVAAAGGHGAAAVAAPAAAAPPGSPILVFGKAVPDTSPTWPSAGKTFFPTCMPRGRWA